VTLNMNRENRLLVVIVIVLTLSVLVTGGLAVYLTVARQQTEGTAAEEPSAEQPEGTSMPATHKNTDVAPGEPRIAFASDQEGDIAIYAMDASGSHVQRVSGPDQGSCIFPSWSPDRQRVAYVEPDEDPTEEDDTDAEIWVSAADGSEHVHVSHITSHAFGIPPAWSPDGTLLALVATGEPTEGNEHSSVIHILRADGSGVERSLALPWTIQHLAWSPVEDELLLVDGDPSAQTVVHVMSSDGKEISEVFRGALMADWSPGGESIVVGDYTSQEILVIDVGQDGQDQAPRTVAQMAMQPVEIAWSPDGVHVAVATTGHYRQGYATNLHVVSLETGEAATVVEGEGWLAWPSWSPDGQSLVFTWGRFGRREGLPFADLWVYDVASGELEQLTTGEDFEGLGAWSP
jgi:Tol biopolymer transport system component